MKILIVIGTRPEAIKLAPLALLLKSNQRIECTVMSSGQHNEMLEQSLKDFDCALDVKYHVPTEGRTLATLTTAVINNVSTQVKASKPDWIIVQGDTTTAFAAALVGFYEQIKIGHVEAGLRSFDLFNPFPEEANRKLISQIATAHFAPTLKSQDYLLKEGIDEQSVFMTGNTVVDALYQVSNTIKNDTQLHSTFNDVFASVDWSKKVILVTAHRRENHDSNMHAICDALIAIAKREDVQIVFPVHLSPKVQDVVYTKLKNIANIHLFEPFSYMKMVYVLSKVHMVVSDSGGIQEEAPSFGKPVLVMRETTERMEAIDAGTAKLVGANTSIIIEETSRLLDDTHAYDQMSNVANPFGDGTACNKIMEILERA